MYQERRSSGMAGIVVIAVLIFVGVAMWWLESRFGATAALTIVGSLVGALLVIAGFMLNLASTRSTLNAASEFNRGLAEVEKYRQMTERERARGDSAWHKANAQITVMNEKRVHQLADQRARMLVDQQRQPQQPQAAEWDWEAEDASNDWNVL